MCPAARKIASLADEEVKVWMLYDMQSLPSWTRGRLVLIGDAAHPFLPCTIDANSSPSKPSSQKLIESQSWVKAAQWRSKTPCASRAFFPKPHPHPKSKED
jgi:hypothetical protein